MNKCQKCHDREAVRYIGKKEVCGACFNHYENGKVAEKSKKIKQSKLPKLPKPKKALKPLPGQMDLF